jgi:predicted glycosyltransferase
MGNFIELEKKYRLIFNYRYPNDAIEKAITLIQDSDVKREWSKKKEKLLSEKIDITAFMVWYIENYPDSFKEMKRNPEIQYKFR